MPEGDTIFRAARTLHRALAGRTVTRFESVFPRLARVDDQTPLRGRTIERVVSSGKHLLIEFSGGLWLRTHLRMNGSWHIYRPGERWQKRRIDMRIVIETDAFVAVAFNIQIAELQTAAELARDSEVTSLGPDLLGETFDVDAAIARARLRNDKEIADLLLDQHVAAGIGNVYKSEVLFLRGISPFRRTVDVTDADLRELYLLARKLLGLNVLDATGDNIVTYSGPRRTTHRSSPNERVWVYGRTGEACRKCGTRIEMRKQGVDARVTFWCGKCQA